MDLSLFVIWAVVISLFTLFGAYYVRRYNRPDAIIALYSVFIVITNVTATKAVEFDLGFTKFFAPVAVMIFAVTFLLTDMVNEKFGRKETQRMIIIALVSQIALVVFSYLILNTKGAPFFENQGAFENLLGNVPRLMIAGFIAYFVSENFDAYLFQWFKRLTGGKYLWMRNVFSSVPAMLLDSVIVVVLGFWGILPVVPLIIGLTVIKWVVAIIDIPFMYLSRRIMGSHTQLPHREIPVPHSGI